MGEDNMEVRQETTDALRAAGVLMVEDRKQARARIGGETGINGDFYEGGKFLPNTEAPKVIKFRNGKLVRVAGTLERPISLAASRRP